ncbi:MAG: hypothetical protein KBS67_05650 [Bacteroidales bacterium]|nr:hypothetical protein [Candidatus Cryptobacteroides equifaecalis]
MRKFLLYMAAALACLSARAQDSRLRVVCWGDSLTADSEYCYPRQLQTMLGDGYEVINCGIGGENTVTIMARQGAAPMYLAHDIQIFRSKDAKYRKFIGSSDVTAFLSLYNGEKVTPLLQGKWEEGSTARVNPVIIEGKKFIISSEAHHWYEKGWKFEYNYFIEATDRTEKSYTLPAGSLVTTQATETLRHPEVNIIFMGQNGGYSDAEELIRQIKLMKGYGAARRTIVISFHAPNEIIRTDADFKKMESLMRAEFGRDYINLRRYMMEDGLKDAGLTPTAEDIEAVSYGRVPPQLLTDGTHFTPAAYKLIAAKVYSIF